MRENTQTAATGNRNSRRYTLPIYIMMIMETYSSREHHVTQEFIAKTLRETYGFNISRRALGRYVHLMLEEDLCLFGDAASGYYYDRLGYYCQE